MPLTVTYPHNIELSTTDLSNSTINVMDANIIIQPNKTLIFSIYEKRNDFSLSVINLLTLIPVYIVLLLLVTRVLAVPLSWIVSLENTIRRNSEKTIVQDTEDIKVTPAWYVVFI